MFCFCFFRHCVLQSTVKLSVDTTVQYVFFSTATKDEVITQLNDLILTSAMDPFEEYCMAFVV